ncbi:hypothetical protein BKA66DRAFT_575141 [Pyrenochaeta sp. MPI-SDFR-AT-0127]|nr:hypothetical protein BKA66DRAFT_575141 [Pyrenochaeta sp. MPI-SDFR-AT-0127]
MPALLQFLALAALGSPAWAAPVEVDADDCSPLKLGQGPVPSPDTAEAFQALIDFSDAALSASTPEGYAQVYSNELVTYNEPAQLVEYIELTSYDVNECNQLCSIRDSCNVFTVFFERSPSLEPGPSCSDPPSTTLIKCNLWSEKIVKDAALNDGQYAYDFHVVIAGSNAYVKGTTDTTPESPESPEQPKEPEPEEPESESPEPESPEPEPETPEPQQPDTPESPEPESPEPESPETEDPESPEPESPESPETESPEPESPEPETPEPESPEPESPEPESPEPESPEPESPEPETESPDSRLTRFTRFARFVKFSRHAR